MQCLKCIIKCLYQFVLKFGKFLDLKFTYLSNYWRFCDFDPSMGHFLLSGVIFLSLRLYIIFFRHYAVLEIYYKMFVPVCFQVWPIFRLQIDIFAELFPILWCLTPPNDNFWLLCGIFLSLRLNKKYFGH